MRLPTMIAVAAAALSSQAMCAVPTINFDVTATYGTPVLVSGPTAFQLSSDPLLGAFNYSGSYFDQFFLAPRVDNGFGSEFAYAIALSGDGQVTDAVFQYHSDGEVELIEPAFGVIGSSYTGSVAGGDVVIDDARFISFQVPEPTQAIPAFCLLLRLLGSRRVR